jgi:hypothetical protein
MAAENLFNLIKQHPSVILLPNNLPNYGIAPTKVQQITTSINPYARTQTTPTLPSLPLQPQLSTQNSNLFQAPSNDEIALLYSEDEGQAKNVLLKYADFFRKNIINQFRIEMTPLMWAAQKGWLSVCEILVSYKADVDQRFDSSSNAAIHYAVMNGHHEIVALFIKKANINLEGTSKHTSLHLALNRQFSETPLIEILDILHVTSRLWDAANIFYPNDKTAQTIFMKERVLRVLEGQAKSVISGLRPMAAKQNMNKSKLDKLEIALCYLEKFIPHEIRRVS